MKKYAIKFVHVVEQTFTAIVEANNEDEAKSLFDADPFGNVKDEEPEDEQGIEIKIESVKEMD